MFQGLAKQHYPLNSLRNQKKMGTLFILILQMPSHRDLKKQNQNSNPKSLILEAVLFTTTPLFNEYLFSIGHVPYLVLLRILQYFVRLVLMGLKAQSVLCKEKYKLILESINQDLFQLQIMRSQINIKLICKDIYFLLEKFRGRQFQGYFGAQCHQ